MPRPVIALLTDFGVRDYYVAAMKGVILGIAPDATLVDITHQIAPQDVLAAAFELRACYRDFPPGSIFLVVVDPGVGTARRPIGASAGGWLFVAPDNGVLAPVLDREGASAVVELSDVGHARTEICRTFEGRDRFAPAAAWLARGTSLGDLGPLAASYMPLDVPQPRVREGVVVGEIVKVDRFGNLISNIERPLLDAVLRAGTPVVRAGRHDVPHVVGTYADAPRGAVCALVGSRGFVEIAANGGSAARLLDLGRGARIVAACDRSALAAAEDDGA